MCLRRPDLIPTIRSVWALNPQKTLFGPVGAVRQALKVLGWSWLNLETFARGAHTPLQCMLHSRNFFSTN